MSILGYLPFKQLLQFINVAIWITFHTTPARLALYCRYPSFILGLTFPGFLLVCALAILPEGYNHALYADAPLSL